jgi:hypothetical protein
LLQALNQANGGAAASLAVAEKYVSAFGELAKETTSFIHIFFSLCLTPLSNNFIFMGCFFCFVVVFVLFCL